MSVVLNSLIRFVALWLGLVAVAQAQPFHIPVYTGTPLMISAGVVTQQTLNRQIAKSRATAKDSGATATAAAVAPAKGPAFLYAGSGPAGVPAKLAASLPGPVRQDAQRVYQEMLDRHPALMKQLGVRSDDLACAVATFLAGSYMAYHDIDFPDHQFAPLYEQVRAAIAADPRFVQAEVVDRRDMFERLAILGTFMAVTHEALKRQPNPKVAADMRLAAKGYLEEFMKLDPERLRLTDQGLVMR